MLSFLSVSISEYSRFDKLMKLITKIGLKVLICCSLIQQIQPMDLLRNFAHTAHEHIEKHPSIAYATVGAYALLVAREIKLKKLASQERYVWKGKGSIKHVFFHHCFDNKGRLVTSNKCELIYEIGYSTIKLPWYSIFLPGYSERSRKKAVKEGKTDPLYSDLKCIGIFFEQKRYTKNSKSTFTIHTDTGLKKIVYKGFREDILTTNKINEFLNFIYTNQYFNFFMPNNKPDETNQVIMNRFNTKGDRYDMD